MSFAATSKGRRRTAIDLFAGAGGATQGLRNAGFTVIAAVENDKFAAASYAANHEDVSLDCRDIQLVEPAAVRIALQMRLGDLTLLKACPPCQGYSSLGKRRPDDPRNALVDSVWHWVRAFLPKAVLLENVPGLESDLRFTLLVRRLRGRGYRVRTWLLDARQFGVPQRRKRLILLAINGTSTRQFPNNPIAMLPKRFFRDSVLLEDVFAYTKTLTTGRDRLHRIRSTSKTVANRIAAIPIGGNRFNLPTRLQLRCHIASGTSASASYGRIRIPGDAPTMTTRCTSPASGAFIHPFENRAITTREAALIQTFPRNYKFIGGPGAVERQIGNAEPVRLAEGLGLLVRAMLR